MAPELTLLRETLERHRDAEELWTPSLPPGVAAGVLGPEVPGPVAALLELTDGPCFGPTGQVFGSGQLPWRQGQENLVGAALPGGGTLADASHFHFFGEVHGNPLLYDRTDGSVWRVPEEGLVWYTGCRLERIADGVEEFFTVWAASPRYLDLVQGTPDEPDDWYRLLRSAGLA
ncbi:hypothetical protein ACFY00_11955 [Kitasatospora sp. NPDC001540]|uniref:hypothetical protein n=1 Tax=Kitasatospora sp. NPDC001540 TaxID=3364014 RepID=UPI00369A2DA7